MQNTTHVGYIYPHLDLYALLLPMSEQYVVTDIDLEVVYKNGIRIIREHDLGKFHQHKQCKGGIPSYCTSAVIRGDNSRQSATSTKFKNGAIAVQFGVVV